MVTGKVRNKSVHSTTPEYVAEAVAKKNKVYEF